MDSSAAQQQKSAFDTVCDLLDEHTLESYSLALKLLGGETESVEAIARASGFATRDLAVNGDPQDAREWFLCHVANAALLIHNRMCREGPGTPEREELSPPVASLDDRMQTAVRGLLHLPPDMRTVMVMIDIHGVGAETVQRLLGTNGDQTARLLSDARAFLRDFFHFYDRSEVDPTEEADG